MNKVLMILVDGMRPDSIENIPEFQEMAKKASYSLDAETVFPSVTLPCHMSLFHSVDPSRHGTTTNIYAPQVRPIDGLFEVLAQSGKKSALFYGWQQLQDLARPGSLYYSKFISGKLEGWENTNRLLTDDAISVIAEKAPDFTFLYLPWVDEAGHAETWMSEEYMRAVKESWKDIKRITDTLSDEYTVIVLADHGGHDRHHGTDMPEDMTIPVIVQGKDFTAGEKLENVSIKDIAPTIVHLLGANPAPEWEGKILVQ